MCGSALSVPSALVARARVGHRTAAAGPSRVSGARRDGNVKLRVAHTVNVSEAIRKQDTTNIQDCYSVLCVVAIGQPEPGRPGSRRASAGTTRRFQPVLTHRSLEDASHEPSRGLTSCGREETRAAPAPVLVAGAGS